MQRGLLVHAIAALATLAAGCSKKSDDKRAPKPALTEPAGGAEAEPTKQPLTAAWFGKTVGPPGALANAKPETRASTLTSEIEGVTYMQVGVAPMIRIPTDKAPLLAEAWGPGQNAKRADKPVTVWFNPETGIRAAFSDEGENKAYLRFERYTPLAKLLGDGKQIAFLDKPFVGKTVDEIKALYPKLVAETGYLSTPPTEWEFADNGTLTPYPTTGAVESLAFWIPFETPEGHTAIMKIIEAKWGKPKSEVELVRVPGEKTWVYNAKDPHIEVTGPGGFKDDAIGIRIGK